MNITFPAAKSYAGLRQSSDVTALLGPTNTGKTYYALERMLTHGSGMIGLPLRLLAREVYTRAAERAGAENVALITGEEKIKPKAPRYWIATVEAMPRGLDLPFVAVDEIQLAADPDRGHIFTDRLLNWRGREETLLIGAATMQDLVRELVPGVRIMTRPRLSKLSFAGEKKITKLPRRSAVVAFSVEDVYAIAEWIRRQRGGAAVVLGALSPRTRNAQVDLFQNGDVDYIVATDAIGMGLNLDVDHIAFASDRKFDGWQHRRLMPAEFGQIAGRAGRYLRDGTFGTTGRCAPFDAALVGALEEHRFDAVRMLQWRNAALDFSSLPALAASLDALPREPGLTRAPAASDQLALEIASRDSRVARAAKTRADIARLWECCQIPDYRKISPLAHAELVLSVFGFVGRPGHIPDDWFARHVAAQNRVDGGIDALSARIAEVRTWTYIANRPDWLRDPGHWQSVTRQVEDNLSDALHERLAQRFVDRRTSVLMRRLRENVMLEAEVTPGGDVLVEGQHIGQLIGFRFTADPAAAGEAARTLNAAAQKALASEIQGRAARLSESVDEALLLANDGIIRWLGEPVGKVCAGAHVLEPRVTVLADEQLTGPALEKVQRRLELWLAQHVKKLLGPLADLEKGEGLDGIVRGIAFQIAESLGVLDRSRVAEEVKALSQEDRAALRKFGVRFGAYHLYLPNLIKPAPRALAAQLHALKHGGDAVKGLDDVLHLAASGRTSLAASQEIPKNLYRAAGFRVCGDRAVRIDILERLADLIRPAISYRPGITPGDPPPGAADGDGFVVTVAMTSLAGCSGESFASILRALGYVPEWRKGPPITPPPLARYAAPLPDGASETVPMGSVAPECPEGAPEACKAQPGGEDFSLGAGQAQPEPPAYLDAESPCAAGGEKESLSEALSSGGGPEDLELSAKGLAGTAPPEGSEESLIEVWRPHRQQHQMRRREGAPIRPAGWRKKDTGAPPRPHAARPPMGEGNGAARAALPDKPTAKSCDPAGAASLAEAAGHESAGRDAAGGGMRSESRRGGWKQPGDKSRLASQERGGPQRLAAAKEKKHGEKPPDPNSPFAKLLELKARLEEKNNTGR